VSQPAVSYAYNRPEQLSAEVRERILRVASDLNYPGPNPVGRGLRRGSVGAIGLMITDSLPHAFDDPATVQLLRGIAEIGEKAEVMLTLLPLRSAAEAEDPADIETRQAKMSGDSLVDGFIVCSLPDRHRAVEAVLSRGTRPSSSTRRESRAAPTSVSGTARPPSTCSGWGTAESEC
jgi:DNA-binding LacI/PurR family transcriptional regulator